jgi:large subunit ribosomal protein L27Ae
VSDQTRLNAQNSKDKKAAVIDVTKSGYRKVLAKGVIPKIPLIVKAQEFSKLAEKRIKQAGGACVLVA